MPMHDWNRVEAGIFHAFHHDWITEVSRALNGGLLPAEYYALPEQLAAGFGPDVLTLQTNLAAGSEEEEASSGSTATLVETRPQTRFTAESESEYYRRKKSSIAVRHVSGDRMVAVVEVVSPGNKASRHAVRALVEKACEWIEHRIHLLILDPLPPGPRDPSGIHSAIWEELQGERFLVPRDKPLTQAAYECGATTRAYIEAIAVGDPLPDMPLFLEPAGYVPVPLEGTYEAAFAGLPRRWRTVLQAGLQP